MNVFDCILEEVTEEEAIEWAQGFVFSECETRLCDRPFYCNYVATVQGDVEVWYDYGADYYFFVEQEDE